MPDATHPSDPDSGAAPGDGSMARVRELFNALSELPRAERGAYLDRCCTNAEDRRKVEDLLVHHDEDSKFLSTPAAHATQLADLAPPARGDALLGFRLGRYTIREVLGAGGMGLVYRAEQENPQRTVALKVIRSFFASPELLRRFRHEAEALGRLRHPCIAQIFEAGTAPDPAGRETPFFAMELVQGRPLLQAAADLSPRDKLALFAAVCDGVHHAHQRGVIHRDLKPGNILVERDEDPSTAAGTTGAADSTAVGRAAVWVRGLSPKILDFGVARLTDADAAMTRSATDAGQVVGTIPYMSPEQVRGDVAHLDTRSDVYSLGVILCELLTGSLPYDLGGKSMVEAARIISDTDPTLPDSHSRALRGDVETILSKTLEKEPDRRYQSAAELAADIRRHLADLPIVARPATASYQLRKFARRHKALVGGVVGTILALALGVVGTGIGLVRAGDARDLAQRRETEARDAQALAETREIQANLETRKARRSVDFLAQMLASADPDLTEGREVTVRELLDQAAKGIESELADEPDVQLSARAAIARTYRAIGAPQKSVEHYTPVLALTRGIHGEGSAEESEVLHEISKSHGDLRQWPEATDFALRALAIRDTRGEGATAAAGRICATLSGAYLAAGDIKNGEIMARRAFEIATTSDVKADIAEAAGLLGTILQRVGGPTAAAEGEEFMKLRLAVYSEMYGPLHSTVLLAKEDLGWFYAGERRMEEAFPLLEESENGYRTLFGPRHRKTLNGMMLRASAYQMNAEHERARDLLNDTIDGLLEVAPDGSELGQAYWRRGNAHSRLKQYPQAEADLRESIRIREKLKDPRVSASYSNLGSVLLAVGKVDEAIEWQGKAVQARRDSGALLSDFGTLLNNYAVSLTKGKRYDEAEAVFKESIEYDKAVRPGNPLNGLNLRPYAEMLQLRGRSAQAEPIAREALQLLENEAKPQPLPDRVRAATVLANILDSLGKADEAAALRTRYQIPKPAAPVPAPAPGK